MIKLQAKLEVECFIVQEASKQKILLISSQIPPPPPRLAQICWAPLITCERRFLSQAKGSQWAIFTPSSCSNWRDENIFVPRSALFTLRKKSSNGDLPQLRCSRLFDCFFHLSIRWRCKACQQHFATLNLRLFHVPSLVVKRRLARVRIKQPIHHFHGTNCVAKKKKSDEAFKTQKMSHTRSKRTFCL